MESRRKGIEFCSSIFVNRSQSILSENPPSDVTLKNVPVQFLYKQTPRVQWSPTELVNTQLGDRVLFLGKQSLKEAPALINKFSSQVAIMESPSLLAEMLSPFMTLSSTSSLIRPCSVALTCTHDVLLPEVTVTKSLPLTMFVTVPMIVGLTLSPKCILNLQQQRVPSIKSQSRKPKADKQK